jgi:hypothetical protein
MTTSRLSSPRFNRPGEYSIVIASLGRMNRAVAARAAVRARSSISWVARSPMAHCAFDASQVPVAGGGCGGGVGPRSDGGVTEPIESEGDVTVPLPLLHAFVNHPARTRLVNAHPETRIVLSAVSGAGMRNDSFARVYQERRCRAAVVRRDGRGTEASRR